MSPVRLYPVGKSRDCSISKSGTIRLPQPVMERLGWQAGDDIVLDYIKEPVLVLLLQKAGEDQNGFRLSYIDHKRKATAGGKVTASRLAKWVLNPRLVLPLMNLKPIYFKNGAFELALILQEIPWQTVTFDKAGSQQMPTDEIGTYRLIGSDRSVQRIGEGNLRQRMLEHLSDDHLVRMTRFLQYITLDKEDAVIVERILLSQHEAQHETLPPFNAIHA